MSTEPDVVIYHNPRCSKSRAAVAAATERGLQAQVREYLKHPPAADEVSALIARLQEPARELVRTDAAFAAAELSEEILEDEAAIAQAIAEHPSIMQRPVLAAGGRAVIGRPTERAEEFLDALSAPGSVTGRVRSHETR